jgi:hypothetical protein
MCIIITGVGDENVHNVHCHYPPLPLYPHTKEGVGLEVDNVHHEGGVGGGQCA